MIVFDPSNPNTSDTTEYVRLLNKIPTILDRVTKWNILDLRAASAIAPPGDIAPHAKQAVEHTVVAYQATYREPDHYHTEADPLGPTASKRLPPNPDKGFTWTFLVVCQTLPADADALERQTGPRYVDGTATIGKMIFRMTPEVAQHALHLAQGKALS